ncbi:hypothetical protein PPUJ20066_26120 [Pseudomonas putida]|nr:hypothetical protein PPUJ20066_26120 [Pseudomonas putida]
MSLNFPDEKRNSNGRTRAPKKISRFIDSLANQLKHGEIYLFGGVLRDLALMGRKGFSSDIDLVVDGDWESCETILVELSAQKNKFGGYRLEISGWPIDIWDARKTWAICEDLVRYDDISSLLRTTVLNWDAILMNWRTKEFICHDDYLIELRNRNMQIVLESNPNPLGMAVRVFRHLCSKDARSIAPHVVEYLADSTEKYTFLQLSNSEISSYGDTIIEPAVYNFFEKIKSYDAVDTQNKFKMAAMDLALKGTTLTFTQLDLDL